MAHRGRGALTGRFSARSAWVAGVRHRRVANRGATGRPDARHAAQQLTALRVRLPEGDRQVVDKIAQTLAG
jgi:hypothetical protein